MKIFFKQLERKAIVCQRVTSYRTVYMFKSLENLSLIIVIIIQTDAACRCRRKLKPCALVRCPLLRDPAPPEQYAGAVSKLQGVHPARAAAPGNGIRALVPYVSEPSGGRVAAGSCGAGSAGPGAVRERGSPAALMAPGRPELR